MKNKFFTRKFVPAQGAEAPESLQVIERYGNSYGEKRVVGKGAAGEEVYSGKGYEVSTGFYVL